MCFSAGASFAASAVLGVSGIYTLSQVRYPRERLIASIPLVFAVHQASEGLLWLALSGHPIWSQHTSVLTTIFLIFSQIIRPIVVPLAVYCYETDIQRKKRLGGLVIVGVVLSLYLAGCMMLFPYGAMIQEHHILYTLQFPLALKGVVSLFYVFAIVFPLFFAKQKQAWQMGILLAGSLVLTKLLYAHYLISVRCFFAALVSISVIHILRTSHRA